MNNNIDINCHIVLSSVNNNISYYSIISDISTHTLILVGLLIYFDPSINIACVNKTSLNIIMNIIIVMNNITCTHINHMNTAIITRIESVVSNISMHMFNTSSGINDNIINTVIVNDIIVIIHINTTVIDTTSIVNDIDTLGLINNKQFEL